MLSSLSQALIVFIAVLHSLIAAVEMFCWKLPAVHRRMGFRLEEAHKSAPLMANQGLYNGFLAAGLFWSATAGARGTELAGFFLGCVFIAGVFGAITARWTILLVQTLPAALALLTLALH